VGEASSKLAEFRAVRKDCITHLEEPPTRKPGGIGVWRLKCGISCHAAIQVALKLMKFCEDGWFREITDKRTLIRPLPIILLILARKQWKISYFRRPKAELTEQGASSIIQRYVKTGRNSAT
jgi:hypothetical protein